MNKETGVVSPTPTLPSFLTNIKLALDELVTSSDAAVLSAVVPLIVVSAAKHSDKSVRAIPENSSNESKTNADDFCI